MIFVALLLLSGAVLAQTSATAGLPASGLAASTNPGSASAGRTLFLGTVRFKNGGPACSACHSVASLPFPQGGTMGPDLTKAYSKLGPQGLNSALETLFFPAMTPLFAYHPLTDDERRNLAAFLQGVDRQQPGTPTWAIAVIALAIVLMLIVVTGIAGRYRIRSVRRALLERVRVQTVAKI
jgi:mono/diheme cytochrome c family protein